jgi:iron complex transport system substrate-binding protein
MNTDGKPQRVVSLLGAATETLYRLGLGDQLVGRSHECDYPKACLALPCISRPRLDVNASSIDIDRAVKSRSAEGEPIYRLDDDVIADLKPDLLIAQDHCRVCAVTPRDV